MSDRRVLLVAMLVAVAPLVAYPLVVTAAGRPTFPGGRGECARVATGDEQGALELVFGHVSSIAAAADLRGRLAADGFANVQVKADGCGYWKVTNDGIDSFAQGRSAADEARAAGFPARVEIDPGS